ncbi:hypothetical protein OHU45_02645 [Streptomyces tubercidicus]|uniref:hypothetical protein n=1 Tax=Streptomyces tubercidicus TaxID=47759 RepID=UPI002E0E8BAA|nr:hypothetical protein OG761_02470 [Streptomyces tubercidicus]WSX24487.1 hypothetical protein OG690_34870 [Streptomyces tubercidicus]
MERLGFSEQQIAEHVAADLAFHCAVRPRTAWRLARELTLDQAAERFNAELGDPRAPMKGSRIWEFEQWPGRGIRPSWKVLRTLGAIYGTPWNRLVDIEDIRELPDPDRKAYRTALSAAAAPSQPEAELQLPSQPPSPSAVGRSGQYGPHPEPPAPESPTPAPQGQTSTGKGTAAGMGANAAESLELAARVSATNVDAETLEQLHQELIDLTFCHLHSPLERSFQRTVQLRDRLSALLQGRQRLSYTRELSVLAAKTCALLAWVCEDLGHPAHALDHARAGWMCAEHADHNGARRWIRISQSRMAYWAGDFVESAQLAADGLRRGGGDDLDACLMLLEARARAVLGDERGARALLRRWEKLPDQGADAQREERFFHLTGDRQRYLAGSSLLLLGRSDEALGDLEHSLTLHDELPCEQRYFGMELISRIDTARARLHNDKFDAVPDLLDPVLAVDPAHRLQMAVHGARPLLRELAAPRHRNHGPVRDLSERLREFCRGADDGRAGGGGTVGNP